MVFKGIEVAVAIFKCTLKISIVLFAEFIVLMHYLYMWPNFGKSTISLCMKQLEFLCLTWYCYEHRMIFEYFWDSPYNFMYLECIQPTIA